MLYEYKVNKDLSMQDVENIYLKSKVIRKITSNIELLVT